MNQLPLTFPTFFQCGIKPFAGTTQKNCIHLLFFGLRADDPQLPREYLDTMCTRFAYGHNALSDRIRASLLSLPVSELENRFRAMSIPDISLSVNALERLVRIAVLSDTAKKELFSHRNEGDPYEFVCHVFLQSIKAKVKGNSPLSKEQLALISRCVNGEGELPEQVPDSSPSEETPAEAAPKPEQHNHVTDILAEKFSIDLSGSTSCAFKEPLLTVTHQPISLPDDFFALLNWARQISNEDNLINIDLADVLAVTNLNLEKKTSDGALELWTLSGTRNRIVEGTKVLDISSCTACLIMLHGYIDISFLSDVVDAVFERCNPETATIFGASFDENVPEDTGTAEILTYKPVPMREKPDKLNFPDIETDSDLNDLDIPDFLKEKWQ